MLGALTAAIGLVVGAVWLETRYYLRRARSESVRRAIKFNGVVYAVLMAVYIALLAWARHAQWSGQQIIATGIVFSVLITLLTLERRKHMKRTTREE